MGHVPKASWTTKRGRVNRGIVVETCRNPGGKTTNPSNLHLHAASHLSKVASWGKTIYNYVYISIKRPQSMNQTPQNSGWHIVKCNHMSLKWSGSDHRVDPVPLEMMRLYQVTAEGSKAGRRDAITGSFCSKRSTRRPFWAKSLSEKWGATATI